MTIPEEMVRRHVWFRERHQAISIAELRQRTGLGEREIKAAVEGLRLRHGLAIGSSRGKTHGYYGVLTADDIRDTVRGYERQAIQMLRVAHKLSGKHRLLELLGQMEMEMAEVQT